jgi:hypothetical protein
MAASSDSASSAGTNSSSSVRLIRFADELILRYPIAVSQRTLEDEDSADATPMILSMQERLSQPIDVGDRVFITDKKGGALPKTGKADSAQVSVINFPLPADGLIETVTLRLFEPPADDSRSFDVILFDREQIGSSNNTATVSGPSSVVSGTPPTRRRMSSASSVDSGTEDPSHQQQQQQQQQQQSTPSAAESNVVRFFVAPDLPYRPSRSQIAIDPQSRSVQTVKLVVPLRGSAGQYLGIMNRGGRLNIAYTPDKKKPAESWSEKSVEVFYMMPRMVPRPFVGGPHPTRDWHGRAGWFATMIVSDPGEAVDPGWQRRCEVDALLRKDGALETKRLSWLLTSLIESAEPLLRSREVLFGHPKLIRALTRVCQLDDNVVDLVTMLCEDATTTEATHGEAWGQDAESSSALTRLHQELRFKAYEMQLVQRGRLTSSFEKFQRVLRCLLAMKRLREKDGRLAVAVGKGSTSVNVIETMNSISPSLVPATMTIRTFRVKAKSLLDPPSVLYCLKKNDTIVVSGMHEGDSSQQQPPSSLDIQPGDELVLSSVPAQEGEGEADARARQFEEMLRMNGPFVEVQAPFMGGFHSSGEEGKEFTKTWDTWTQPFTEVKYRRVESSLPSSGNGEFALSGGGSGHSLSTVALGSVAPRTSQHAKQRDWFDDLERATGLLDAFGRGAPPPASFAREHFFAWQQHERRVRVESAHPLMFDPSKEQEWSVRISNASKLKLEWSSSSKIGEFDGSCLVVSNGSGHRSLLGRCGAPPPIDTIEGDRVTIRLVRAKEFDPGEMLLGSKRRERKVFPLARGLENAQGDAAKYVVVDDRTGIPKFSCAKCASPNCCNASGNPPENNEGRFVSPFPSRNSWVCSACVSLPAPCSACGCFPYSAALQPVCVRTKESFVGNEEKYEAYLRQSLVPGMPVMITTGENDDDDGERRFLRFLSDGSAAVSAANAGTLSVPASKLKLCPMMKTAAETAAGVVAALTSSGLDSASTWATTATAPSASALSFALEGGTFAINDLGPDIAISNLGLTVTRLRSMGWGTQRMSRFLDASCGSTSITFRIDRNSSNHLFFGVVGPNFTDWSKRLMETGAWSIRRDGSTHADGRERSSASPHAHLVTGETLTMIVDMQSEPRSVCWIQNGALLEKLEGLPSRVVPAVSFGGSNQIVSIIGFSLGGGRGITGGEIAANTSSPTTSNPTNPIAAPLAATAAVIPAAKRWGFAVDVIPEFDVVDEAEFAMYMEETHGMWTKKMDHLLVMHCDEICAERKLGLLDVLEKPGMWNKVFCQPNRFHIEALLLENPKLTLKIVGRRFEWIRAFNASVARALPLLDLNFSGSSPSSSSSAEFDPTPTTKHLGHCSHLFLQIVKRPMWEDALETTRTEEGQFEVVLDYGKAMAHRQFCDSNAQFTVFSQAFRAMHFMPSSRLRGHGQLYRATMRGMRAHDDGGPYRQSFHTYCAELLSVPGTGLFLPCANRVNEIYVNRDRWLPNPQAKSTLALNMYMFVGKLMGIAIRNAEYLDLRLPSMVWKLLCNQQVEIDDLRQVDLLFVNVLDEVRQGGEGMASSLSFTLPSLDGRVVEIISNGAQRVLDTTDPSDCQDWIDAAMQYKLHEFDLQIEAIRRGLHCIVPQRMLVLFTWEELELMVCGRPKIDLQLLREMTVYVGCSEHDAHIRAFWHVLQSWTEERKSLYLRFVWGRSRLPTSKSSWGDMYHKISTFEVGSSSRTSTADDLLPRSHTCYFSLDLPRYSNEDVLRKKLLFAIENCTEIDADQTTTGNRSAAMGFELEVDHDDDDEGVDVAVVSKSRLSISSEQNQGMAQMLDDASFVDDVALDDIFDDDMHEIIGADLALAMDSLLAVSSSGEDTGGGSSSASMSGPWIDFGSDECES